jgi:hypothetical protein
MPQARLAFQPSRLRPMTPLRATDSFSISMVKDRSGPHAILGAKRHVDRH